MDKYAFTIHPAMQLVTAKYLLPLSRAAPHASTTHELDQYIDAKLRLHACYCTKSSVTSCVRTCFFNFKCLGGFQLNVFGLKFSVCGPVCDRYWSPWQTMCGGVNVYIFSLAEFWNRRFFRIFNLFLCFCSVLMLHLNLYFKFHISFVIFHSLYDEAERISKRKTISIIIKCRGNNN